MGLVAAIAVSMWVGGLHAPAARAADEPSATGKHDDPQAAEARRHYEEGTKAFNLGEYPRAVTEFKSAYNAKPDPLLLYNIGQSFRLGGDASQALFFYRSFLRNMPTAPNRKEVEGRIRALEKQVEEQKRDAPPGSPPVTAPPSAAAMGTGAAGKPAPAGTSPGPDTTPAIGGDTTGHRASDAPAGSTATPMPPVEPVARPPLATEPTTPARPTVELSQPAPGQSEPTSSPFYKKWWFWTGVGVVLLVGIGAAAFRDKPPSTTYGLHDPMFAAPHPP